ncbi:hypothetical protein LPJ57_003045 [Coemansia sp. RSA 486]|nr:hypothetical protein LPJ57_003045 [Coemansia sp. RSA 486]KAJ2640136.1 hypothetical protein GGF40_000284 [Coemansia sp. RSA 1286]
MAFPSENIGALAPQLSVCKTQKDKDDILANRSIFFESGAKGTWGFNDFTDKGPTRTSAGSTNIHLATINSQHPLAETFVIHINYREYMESLAQDKSIIALLQKCDWRNVKTLDICIDIVYKSETEIFDHESESVNLDNITRFADILHKTLPNVTTLRVSQRKYYADGIAFGRRLVHNYGSRLESFICDCKEVSSALASGNNLENLTVTLDYEKICQIRDVDIKKLKSLHMSNVPHGFAFNYLHSSSHAEQLTFENLAELSIGYVDKTRESIGSTSDSTRALDTPKRVSFPALQKLCLSLATNADIEHIFFSGIYDWPRVTTLQFDCLDGLVKGIMFSSAERNEIAERIATHICQNMPNITHITAKEIDYKDKFRANTSQHYLISLLVANYHKQLVHLNSVYSVLDVETIYPTMLETLSLSLKLSSTLCLIRECSHSLKTLCLSDVAHGFSWTQINGSSVAACDAIDFANLTSMEIVYSKSGANFNSDLENFIQKKQENINESVQVNCPVLEQIAVRNATLVSLPSIFSFGEHPWSKVSKIALHFRALLYNAYTSEHNSDIPAEIQDYIKQLASKIPGVVELGLFGQDTSIMHVICSAMASSYGQQLDKIESNLSFSSNSLETLSDNLRFASIEPSPEDCLDIPVISSKCLESLAIGQFGGVFSWNLLVDLDLTNILRLNKLKKLCIGKKIGPYITYYNSTNYSSGISYDKSPSDIVKVYLPNINDIQINFKDMAKSPGKSELYMDNVHNIKLSGSVNCLPKCGKTGVTVTNQLEVTITSCGQNDENEFYQLTNDWFGEQNQLACSSLRVDSLDIDLNVDKVGWEALSCLHIEPEIGLGLLIELVAKLPNLVDLHFARFHVKDLLKRHQVHDKERSKEQSADIVVPVLSATLIKLYVGSMADEDDSETAEAGINYFVRALPSLVHLSTCVHINNVNLKQSISYGGNAIN